MLWYYHIGISSLSERITEPFGHKNNIFLIKAPVAVTLEICWRQNIFVFSMIFSEFYPLRGCRLLQHCKTMPLWSTGPVISNFNGHFDFPPFSMTGNITKKTKHTMSQWQTFFLCITFDYSVQLLCRYAQYPLFWLFCDLMFGHTLNLCIIISLFKIAHTVPADI